MVLTSPRSAAITLASVPSEWKDEEEHRKILAGGIRQLQGRSRMYPVVVMAVSANYTMTDEDALVEMDATAGNRTVTLLTAASREGRRIVVKKTDASDNLVIIDGAGSETLEGSLTVSLTQKGSTREYISDGENWKLISAIGNATTL